MSVKHVKDYYLKVANDYKELNSTLKMLEEMMTNDSASSALKNIENLKQQVDALKENYLRISYIVYLLNLPNRKEKQKKYKRQEGKKIKDIPAKDTMDGVLKENKEILESLTNLK